VLCCVTLSTHDSFWTTVCLCAVIGACSCTPSLNAILSAGFFLFAVQPFRLGDRIAVRSMASGESAATSPGPTGGWYEGSCEQVDLRQAAVLSHMSHAPPYNQVGDLYFVTLMHLYLLTVLSPHPPHLSEPHMLPWADIMETIFYIRLVCLAMKAPEQLAMV